MRTNAANGRRIGAVSGLVRQAVAFATKRSRVAAIVTAVLGTAIFAVPILQALKPGTAHWPAFLLSGDIRLYLFPQYIAGYYRFWHGGIAGLDFATDGGASIFGFRPNMPQYYPPYLLSYLVFDISHPKVAAVLLSLMQLVHVAIALFFTVRLGARFLSLRTGSAVLLAVMYALSYTTCDYYFYFLYFFQITLMPLVAYALCDLLFRRRLMAAIVASPIFLTYFLTNYGPTMAMGLIAALMIAAAVFMMHLRPRLGQRAYACLIIPAMSLAIAGIVVLPFYLGEEIYHQIASSVPTDINTSAFSGSFNGTDLVSAFSWLLPGATPTEGSLHWGLIPPLVLVLGLYVLLGESTSFRRLRSLLSFSLGIFAIFLSICFGQASIFPDIFYTYVPILGTMHLFQRYLMFGQFFLWLPVAIAAQVFSNRASARFRQVCFLVIIALWLITTLIIALTPGLAKSVNVGWLLVEGMTFCVGAVILISGRGSIGMAALAVPIAATSLWPIFGEGRGLGTPEFWSNHLNYDYDQLNTLSRAFDGSGSKVLPKVLDLTADIDSFVGRNEPWLLFSRKPVMNFLGYEPHLAMDQNYARLMGDYGHFDRNWVLHSGVDTVIWNAASEVNLRLLTVDTVTVAETVSIGNGYNVSRLRYSDNLSPGVFLPSISIPEDHPELWKLATLDGWKLVGGRAAKVQNGVSGNLSVPFAPNPGERYEVSLTVEASTRGQILVSFGNVAYAEPIPGAKPGNYTRTYTAKEPGGLWINGSADFDGSVTNIIIRQAPDPAIPELPFVTDNGVLKLEAGDRESVMTHFETNWTKRVSADVDVSSQARVVYDLWPIPYMVPYLDGQAVSWNRVGRNPGFLDLPIGHHHVEVVFKSRAADLFAIFSVCYILIFMATSSFLLLEGSLRGRGKSGTRAMHA